MREFALCKELTRKISRDLGATPISLGQISVTHSDLLTKIELKVSVENQGIINVPVWYGETKGDESIFCCLLAALDPNPDQLEYICIFGFKGFDNIFQQDNVQLSLHYDWTNEDDPGTILMKAENTWISISLAQKLHFALGLELLTQDGCLWQTGVIPDEMRKDLMEAIDSNQE